MKRSLPVTSLITLILLTGCKENETTAVTNSENKEIIQKHIPIDSSLEIESNVEDKKNNVIVQESRINTDNLPEDSSSAIESRINTDNLPEDSSSAIESRMLDEVKVTVVDNTEQNLTVIKKDLPWGRWVTSPTSKIDKYSKNTFVTRGTIFAGTEGFVEYSIYGGSFKVHWDFTHWGKRNHRLEINDPHHSYEITCIKCNTNDFTVQVNQRIDPTSYNVFIASDPQAWRLSGYPGHDHNTGQSLWEQVNKKVVESIKISNDTNNFAFGIINGDITEFGRPKTRRSFDEIYTNQIAFPLLLGLGNHDYANNVNDCSIPSDLNFSMNACARSAVFDLVDRIGTYRPYFKNISFDYDTSKRSGSLGYSWDKGNIHFVQLNNYPTYAVLLDHFDSKAIVVKKSLDWLEEDLKKAHKMNKLTILNFHDSDDHFKKATAEEVKRLDQMIKDYNVMAVFSGHSHNAGTSAGGVLKNVRHYNSGALFQGDFLKVAVRNNCIDVTHYNGSSGKPLLRNVLGTTCGTLRAEKY